MTTPSKVKKKPIYNEQNPLYNEEQLRVMDEMSGSGCSLRSICRALGKPKDYKTLQLHYGERIESNWEKTKGLLRVRLLDVALGRGEFEGQKDTTMMIFLGKSILGLSDQPHLKEASNKELPLYDDS